VIRFLNAEQFGTILAMQPFDRFSPRKGKNSAPTCGRQTRRFGMKIVVIGGSGLVGKKLVKNLRQHGHEVVAASPSSGVNTLTGEGLAEALTDAQVVVDVANSPSFEDKAVLEFFETAGRNLLAAEAAAGVGHHVARHRATSCERLLPRKAGPGNPGQGFPDSLYGRPRNAVLRVREQHRPIGHRRSNGSVATQARDEEGKVYTVRYEAVSAMLLNEFLKEHRTVQELKSNAARQDAIIAEQQKQIEALSAGLQKVRAQVQMSKPAPQTVLNNQ